MIKHGTPEDYQQNESRNFVAHNIASAPSSPVKGQLWYDTANDLLKWWNGAAWINSSGGTPSDATTSAKGIVQLAGDLAGTAASPQIAAGAIVDADVNSGAAIALSKLATDPLARANHTGTQLAATISDFNTATRLNRLDQMAAPTASVGLNSQKIVSLLDGTANGDAATWGQVQALIQGVKWLGARLASTATFSEAGATATTLPVGGTTLTVDGLAAANGDYVLAKNQTTAARNGLYVVSGIGSSVVLTRAPEMDTAAEMDGKAVLIEDGTQAGTLWYQVTDVTTLGTDAVTFTQFNKATDIIGGAGLALTGTTLDVNVDSSSIEINADTLRVKALGIVNSMIAAGTIDLTTKVTGALPLANGGTGQTTAKLARESGLIAAGYYSNAETHGAGTTITITQATHGLRASKALNVQTYDAATGDRRIDDINVASSGNVVITFAVSQSANSVGVVITG